MSELSAYDIALIRRKLWTYQPGEHPRMSMSVYQMMYNIRALSPFNEQKALFEECITEELYEDEF